MLQIYHNPRCRKSREGLEYLKNLTENFKVIDYMKTGLKIEDLKEILLKTNLEPLQILRTQEEIFKKQFKGKSFNREEWMDIICEFPNLLQRPIVVSRIKALIGLPAERIKEILT